MRKNTLIIVMILSMFIFGLQMAEPLTAASLNVVDHGSIKFKVHNNAGTYTEKHTKREITTLKCRLSLLSKY